MPYGSPGVGFEPRTIMLRIKYGACLRPIRQVIERLAPRAGFEPAANRLTADRSTTELPRNDNPF